MSDLMERNLCNLHKIIERLCILHTSLILSYFSWSSWDICNAQLPIMWLSTSLLSTWVRGKGCYWYSNVCFLPWSSPWNQQRRKIKKKINDKSDDFTFPIVNIPCISSNIPESPAYGVYLSQLIRILELVPNIVIVLDRAQLLT